MAEQRKKRQTAIIAIIVAGVIYAATQWDRLVNQLRVTFNGISFRIPFVDVSFLVYNPTDLAAVLTRVDGQILYNGSTMALVSQPIQNVVIPSNSSFNLNLSVLPAFANIYQAAKNEIETGRESPFVFDGKLTINNIPIPYKEVLS